MSSVEISIEFIREVTLCGHFCWLSARVKIPVLWSNLFFHGVEGWACGIGSSSETSENRPIECKLLKIFQDFTMCAYTFGTNFRDGAKFTGPQHWKLLIFGPEKSLGPLIFFSQKSSSPFIFLS